MPRLCDVARRRQEDVYYRIIGRSIQARGSRWAAELPLIVHRDLARERIVRLRIVIRCALVGFLVASESTGRSRHTAVRGRRRQPLDNTAPACTISCAMHRVLNYKRKCMSSMRNHRESIEKQELTLLPLMSCRLRSASRRAQRVTSRQHFGTSARVRGPQIDQRFRP